MKKLFLVLTALISVSAVLPAYATEQSALLSESTIANLPRVIGSLRKVDLANSQVTIKHERIPNLGMPAMTMTFAVPDNSIISGLKANDKVLFSADMINDVLTLVWIQKQNKRSKE